MAGDFGPYRPPAGGPFGSGLGAPSHEAAGRKGFVPEGHARVALMGNPPCRGRFSLLTREDRELRRRLAFSPGLPRCLWH